MRKVGKETSREAEGATPKFGGPKSTSQKHLIDCNVLIVSHATNSISVFLASMRDALSSQCKETRITSFDSPELERLLEDSEIVVFLHYGHEDTRCNLLLEKIRLIKPDLIKIALSSDPKQATMGNLDIVLDKHDLPSQVQIKEQIESILAKRE